MNEEKFEKKAYLFHPQICGHDLILQVLKRKRNKKLDSILNSYSQNSNISNNSSYLTQLNLFVSFCNKNFIFSYIHYKHCAI